MASIISRLREKVGKLNRLRASGTEDNLALIWNYPTKRLVVIVSAQLAHTKLYLIDNDKPHLLNERTFSAGNIAPLVEEFYRMFPDQQPVANKPKSYLDSTITILQELGILAKTRT